MEQNALTFSIPLCDINPRNKKLSRQSFNTKQMTTSFF
jgi:hypothetical protein